MFISWSSRRKFLYLSVAALIVAILAIWAWFTFFYKAPTCFDGVQNGNERGVDCGGSCSLICASDTHQPVVLWSRLFPTSPGIYTAAAYVQNANVGAGARAVHYSFQLFDDTNSLVIERDGVMDLPPIQTVPIIETNISTGNRTASRVLFAFSNIPVWNTVQMNAIPTVRVTGQVLAPDGSRLSATIANDTVLDTSHLTVDAVLFDVDGVARASSKSEIVSLPHKTSQDVVFTWPYGIPNIVRAEITVLPSF